MSETPFPTKAAIAGQMPALRQGQVFDGFLSLRQILRRMRARFRLRRFRRRPGRSCHAARRASWSSALALWTEVAFEPPFWVHLLIFLPLTLIVCLGLLRPLKGFWSPLQFRNKAEQGRLKD